MCNDNLLVMTDCMYSYCLAVSRAKNIARQADVVAALTLEVLQGSIAPYDAGMYICNICTQLFNQLYCDRCTHRPATQWPAISSISTEITSSLQDTSF